MPHSTGVLGRFVLGLGVLGRGLGFAAPGEPVRVSLKGENTNKVTLAGRRN